MRQIIWKKYLKRTYLLNIFEILMTPLLKKKKRKVTPFKKEISVTSGFASDM